MHHKSIPYRDTRAAPGSQLHEALTAGDRKRADAIYHECERELAKLERRAPKQEKTP